MRHSFDIFTRTYDMQLPWTNLRLLLWLRWSLWHSIVLGGQPGDCNFSFVLILEFKSNSDNARASHTRWAANARNRRQAVSIIWDQQRTLFYLELPLKAHSIAILLTKARLRCGQIDNLGSDYVSRRWARILHSKKMYGNNLCGRKLGNPF